MAERQDGKIIERDIEWRNENSIHRVMQWVL